MKMDIAGAKKNPRQGGNVLGLEANSEGSTKICAILAEL